MKLAITAVAIVAGTYAVLGVATAARVAYRASKRSEAFGVKGWAVTVAKWPAVALTLYKNKILLTD